MYIIEEGLSQDELLQRLNRVFGLLYGFLKIIMLPLLIFLSSSAADCRSAVVSATLVKHYPARTEACLGVSVLSKYPKAI